EGERLRLPGALRDEAGRVVILHEAAADPAFAEDAPAPWIAPVVAGPALPQGQAARGAPVQRVRRAMEDVSRAAQCERHVLEIRENGQGSRAQDLELETSAPASGLIDVPEGTCLQGDRAVDRADQLELDRVALGANRGRGRRGHEYVAEAEQEPTARVPHHPSRGGPVRSARAHVARPAQV